MTSAPVRDPLADHLITPQNAALLLIDYQPAQVGSVRSMDHELLVKNAASTVRTIKAFDVPVVHSTVNVASGQGPTIPELAGLLENDKPLDRTTVNSWEDTQFQFGELTSDDRIAAAATSLETNGIRSVIAGSGAEARRIVRRLLPEGAEVYNNTSRTLETIEVADDIEQSGRYQPLRPRLWRMDRKMQEREIRTLAAAPDYVVGSVHALTDGGSLLIASASGSQLGPIVSGAAHVILVIGGQKIVTDVAAGMRRIYEYCYPLEDARARQAYGVPSGVNNVLVINRVLAPGRVTAILVKERLGF